LEPAPQWAVGNCNVPRLGIAEAMRAQTQEPLVLNGGTQSVVKVPLPRKRPSTSIRMASLAPAPGAEGDQSPNPFSKVGTAIRNVFAMLQPSNSKVASASSGGGILGDGRGASPLAGMNQTAVYDITARTVYMPDGTRLEAHSGLGDLMDDPSHVDLPNRGQHHLKFTS
jgi:hypothetical protein